MTVATASRPQYPALDTILSSLYRLWPQSQATMTRYYKDKTEADFSFLNSVAGKMLRITGANIDSYVEDYKWTCGLMLRAEMHYMRHRKYEKTNFEEVMGDIYRSEGDMKRYMRGLMMSQILWRHHTGPLQVFAETFLPMCPKGSQYLDIGPGHGLWMAMASEIIADVQLSGWDISPYSLDETRGFLKVMGVEKPVSLEVRDICAPMDVENKFDAAVISQVLEIVPDPDMAVKNIAKCLKPGGKLFLNAPMYAAAPDHIRRWNSKHELLSLLDNSGFDLNQKWLFGSRAESVTDGSVVSFVAIATVR